MTDPVRDVGEHDQADEYSLAFSRVDGWELCAGDECFANHHSIDLGNISAAKVWAAATALDERGVTITGWQERPHRRDPDSLEYAGTAA